MADDGFDATASLQEASARLLTDALTTVLKRLNDMRDFVDLHSALFLSYTPGGEHMLEWTDIHNAYCMEVETILHMELQVLGLSEEALLDHASRACEDPAAEQVLSRLLAKTDYEHFCAMMRAEAFHEASDEDDAYEYVEVEAAGDRFEQHRLASGGVNEYLEQNGEDDEDEGLLEALLEQAVATMRVTDT